MKKNFKRKIFKGEWTCADCGRKITELPFLPDPKRPVYCRKCHLKRIKGK